MIRTIQTVSRQVVANPPVVVNIVANTSTQVLQNLNGDPNATPPVPPTIDEVYARYLFNSGTTNLYFRINGTCDGTVNFNGWIVPGQQLDCSDHPQSVAVFATQAGGQVAVTILCNKDLDNKN